MRTKIQLLMIIPLVGTMSIGQTIHTSDIAGGHTDVSAQEAGQTERPALSDRRIQEKKSEYQQRIRTSRYAWRATAGTIGVVSSVGLWYLLAGPENETVQRNTQQAQLEKLASEMANMKSYLNPDGTLAINAIDQKPFLQKITSYDYWKPTASMIIRAILSQSLITAVSPGIQSIIHECITFPKNLYDSLVDPVYLSNLSRFKDEQTQLQETRDRINRLIGHDFDQFKAQRDHLLKQFIDDIESVLAFLSCAYDALYEDLGELINQRYDNICLSCDTLLENAYHDDKRVVQGFVTTTFRDIDNDIAAYNNHVKKHPFISW